MQQLLHFLGGFFDSRLLSEKINPWIWHTESRHILKDTPYASRLLLALVSFLTYKNRIRLEMFLVACHRHTHLDLASDTPASVVNGHDVPIGNIQIPRRADSTAPQYHLQHRIPTTHKPHAELKIHFVGLFGLSFLVSSSSGLGYARASIQ